MPKKPHSLQHPDNDTAKVTPKQLLDDLRQLTNETSQAAASAVNAKLTLL